MVYRVVDYHIIEVFRDDLNLYYKRGTSEVKIMEYSMLYEV